MVSQEKNEDVKEFVSYNEVADKGDFTETIGYYYNSSDDNKTNEERINELKDMLKR